MSVESERELIHRGAKFDFERVRVVSPTGRVLAREVVRHPGAVCILPLLETPEAPLRIVMIRNFRIALGKELWELPAGTLEPPEPPEVCAARELVEETGFQAQEIKPIGAFYTTPGMTDEWMRSFVARGLIPVGQRLEEDERIQPHVLDAREVFSMIDRGELVDAKSIVTLSLALRQGLIAPASTAGDITRPGLRGVDR